MKDKKKSTYELTPGEWVRAEVVPRVFLVGVIAAMTPNGKLALMEGSGAWLDPKKCKPLPAKLVKEIKAL
jgi:exosome complex RNA-binding protein Csl4